MYETEANPIVESADQIPAEQRAAFAGLRGQLLARTTLPWSEHCTECAWPTCYTTCDLYQPREDGRCRRFVDGMVRVDCPESVNGYLLKIRFKRWGKLWTPGFLKMVPMEEAAAREHRDYQVGSFLYQLPVPRTVKRVAVTKRYSFKKRMAMRGGRSEGKPTAFMIECLNPSPEAISLTFSLRGFEPEQRMPFQKKIELTPGFHRIRIAVSEAARVVNLEKPFGVEVVPNEVADGTTLYFGLMDFVEEKEVPVALTGASAAGKVKCVVWDLDNTLWDGVLIEDGAQALRLKPGIEAVIRELDERGILQSVASKNNADEAIGVLKGLQLEEYFLYPQISWEPKSASMRKIAKLLNIGADSLLFVDDSPFERSEVAAVCPEIETMDASEYGSLLDRPRCVVPVTDESRQRRTMYQTEQQRQAGAELFEDDYLAFLKDCAIEMTLSRLTEENAERVHELTQRTNQMNFSGNRYDRGKLEEIRRNPNLDTYVISCADRFGSYGIVGFGIVDKRKPVLTDLMFSCRVQAKRVEHAFLSHVLQRYREKEVRDFHANYRKTPRNQPSGKVFADMGMQETGVTVGVTSLVFSKDAAIPEDGVIRVLVELEAKAGGAD